MRVLEEIVVTARRREESQQDVPIAITAMSEDFLRAQNIGELEDLGTHVPSLRITSAGTDTNTPLISIRGQRPSEAKIELDAAAPMYVNDVVMTPSTGTNLALYDLQNLQVLKGPQGTLFGRNSTGGAILVTPKRPGDALGGYVEAQLGNYGLKHIEGAVDVPVTDELTMRIAGRRVERDGYQENIAANALHGDDYRGEDSEAVRLSINYGSDRFNNLTVLAYDNNESGAPIPHLVGFNSSAIAGQAYAAIVPEYAAAVQENIDRDDPWKVKADIEGEDNVTNTFASNTTEFDITESLTVKNIFGYRKVKREAVTDSDGTALPVAGAIPDYDAYTDNGYPVPISTVHPLYGPITIPAFGTGYDINGSGQTQNPDLNETEAEQFSNEIQLLGSAFDERMDWIVGAYWYSMEGTVNEDLVVIPARPSLNTHPLLGAGGANLAGGQVQHSRYSTENTAYGLFGEGTFSFNDSWSLTAGLRQSWDEREITVSKYQGPLGAEPCVVTTGGVVEADCSRNESESYSSPTWRLSANYTPEDDTLVYFSIATGYKAGGFNGRGSDDVSLQPFDEETVTTYELGYKGDWQFDWAAVRTNLALYWQDYEDIQQTRSLPSDTGSLTTETVNAGKAEIKGLEFDVTVAPTDSLLLSLAYSYVDAGYKDNVVGVNARNALGGYDTTSVDRSDAPFTYIPEQSLTASVTYTLPLDSSLGEMSLMASVYWQDEMQTNQWAGDFDIVGGIQGWSDANIAMAEEVSTIDAYEVLNLRFDWRNIMGSNFDVAAFVSNATDEEYVTGGLNVIDIQYVGYTYGAPRTYGASLRYLF
ncbi:TonB-dependent receptor [Aestuariicella hydrocarbonica]|uniref:TonB-dependent receptor n=1 Tax=Pseudomaricurvus hydrocarbonicus TaxID=1470433 RepID=A0A9E5MMC3_9GAMM|nr:TonB-dependent receptor [Aestuariicella hydrocarbonica]NHO65960.1 TonB-dependent receptor [Aestuariicella hydrocarbonica]